MSEDNPANNRVVWCDILVADLERAMTFYRAGEKGSGSFVGAKK